MKEVKIANRRNIKLSYMYDGSRYFGFQRQPKQITVQGEIEKILKLVCNEEINMISAGRTDRGVHAKHQVSNFYTSSNISADKFKYLLNRALPQDIYVFDVEDVEESFNSRHDAKYREYEYIISFERNPFEAKYVKYFQEKIDVEKLKEIFSSFVGIKDFKNFRLNDCVSRVSIREIMAVNVEKIEENKIKITVRGSSFLKSQIRIMVGTALEVYKGKLPRNYIELLLNDFSKEYRKILAEPEGLYLSKIVY
nr:tRNA pseudouridine(38-40) synthase TruA [uncultured Fusobacterium sp.]